jgi:hypothetical protein
MTPELPSSAGALTISPSPETRKLLGTEERRIENEFPCSAEKTSSKMVQVKLEFLVAAAYREVSHQHGKSGDRSH